MKQNFVIAVLLLLMACNLKTKKEAATWQTYGGNPQNNHYSSLKQLDTSNITKLKPAWIFHTGDADALSQIQVNPIIINGILYGVSPQLKLFALNAQTGKRLWQFDPAQTGSGPKGKGYFAINACRGVAYFEGGKEDKRLFYTAGSSLYCIDAAKGTPIPTFGNGGSIDLHQDLDRNARDLYVTSTTPGILYKDLLIIGTRVSEELPAAPGHIRAYDVHTGKLRWIFHTIPHPNEYGYESWQNKNAYLETGGANSWAGFSLDTKKGIVFASTGSASYDFYGGNRIGNNLFANSVIAIDAASGKRIWHYQTVHHDVWDRDLPTAPVLVDLKIKGARVAAVAQVTKTGFVFVLDRNTGQPVFPVVEKPVPVQTELAGEILSPTQPYPLLPHPFVRQSFSAADLNKLVDSSAYLDVQQKLAGYKTGNLFTPPSRQGTIIFPGFDGGAEWGGPSFDPETGILYVNANEVPWVLKMIDNTSPKTRQPEKETNLIKGTALYTTFCAGCHGADKKGGGNYPSLVNLQSKYSAEAFKNIVSEGRRMMPSFKQLDENEKTALASYIMDDRNLQSKTYENTTDKKPGQQPYSSTGYNKFLTNQGYPAVNPPWGTFTAINLNTGEQVWKNTLGDYPEFKEKGIHTGTENYGGSVVTAGGLLFIAATKDSMFRAFNKRTGALLWETKLPAPGFATPAVYEAGGKQYIVIACGGGKLQTPSADVYIAFSL